MAFKEFNDVDSNGLNDVSQPKEQNKFDMSDSDEIAEQLEREELDEGQDDLDPTDKLERDAVTEMEEPPPELEDDVFSETTEQPEVPQETQLPSDDVENGYTPEDVSVAQVENSDGQESEGPEADAPGVDDIEIDVEPESLGTSREEEPVDDPETDMDISDDMVAAPDEKATDIDEPDPEAEDDIIVHSGEAVSTEHASVDEPDESHETETEPVVQEQVELSSEPAPPEEEQNAQPQPDSLDDGADTPEQPVATNVEQAPATDKSGRIEQAEGGQPPQQEEQPPQEANANEKAPEEPNVVGASDQTHLHEGGDHPDDTKQPDTDNETTVAEPEQPISVDQSEKTDAEAANLDQAPKKVEEAPASVDGPDETQETETGPTVQEQVEPSFEPAHQEEEQNAHPAIEARDGDTDAPEQPIAANVEHAPAAEENGHIEQPEGEQPMLQEEQPSREMNTNEKAPEEPPKNIEEEPASVDEPDESHEAETEPVVHEQVEPSSEPAPPEEEQNASPAMEVRDDGTDAPEQTVATNVEQAPATDENGRMEQPESEQPLSHEEQPTQEANTNEKNPEEPNVVGASDQTCLHEGGDHPDGTKQLDMGNENMVAEPEQPISVDQSEKTDSKVANPDEAPKNVEEPPASVEPVETKEPEQSNIPDDAQAEQQKADAEKLQEVSEKTEVDATTPTSLEDHRNNEEQPPQNTEAPDAQHQNDIEPIFVNSTGVEHEKELQPQPVEQETTIAEAASKTRELSQKFYNDAGEKAYAYADLRTYSDHREQHVEAVAVKSSDAAEVIEKASTENGLYGDIDRKELEVSALWHDTGMDGGNFREYQTGHALRKDHSLNSAIHALEYRDEFLKLGVSADSVALNCMLHSKSCSGVRDLTDNKQMTACMDKIDAAAKQYNDKHSDSSIYFDKSRWINDPQEKVNGTYTFAEDEIAKMRASAAALRLGDANRDAPEVPMTQGGESIHVDTDSFKRDAIDWEDEISTAKIYLEDSEQNRVELNCDTDNTGYGRMYAAGEGNLSKIDCRYNSDANAVQEQFVVSDGSSFPHCTQKCIDERLQELDTIKGINREAVIQLSGKYTPEECVTIAKSYGDFCKSASSTYGFKVSYNFMEDTE